MSPTINIVRKAGTALLLEGILGVLYALPVVAGVWYAKDVGFRISGSEIVRLISILLATVACLIVYGSLHMRNARNYNLALAAAIGGTLWPLLLASRHQLSIAELAFAGSMCCIGLWAISVLIKPEVKLAFNQLLTTSSE